MKNSTMYGGIAGVLLAVVILIIVGGEQNMLDSLGVIIMLALVGLGIGFWVEENLLK